MDEKWLRRKYAYYYDELQKLGKFPLYRDVMLKDLNLPQTIIKTGYRDIKKLGLHKRATLVEFLEYVSLQKVLENDGLGWESPDGRNAMRLSVRRPDLFMSTFYSEETDLVMRLIKEGKPEEIVKIAHKKKELLNIIFNIYIDEVAKETLFSWKL